MCMRMQNSCGRYLHRVEPSAQQRSVLKMFAINRIPALTPRVRRFSMKAAVVQMTTTPVSLQQNLDTVSAIVSNAVSRDRVQLVLLPEYWATLGMKDVAATVAESNPTEGSLKPNPIQTFMSELAALHKIWIVGGTIPMLSQSESASTAKYRNTLLVFDPNGARVARYDKLHLFRFEGPPAFDEAATVEGGEPVPVTVKFGDTGFAARLSVCYDVRFPELYRFRNEEPYNMIVVPSAFTVETGKAHWECLLKARAIENQSYVLASAQVGVHPITNRTTYGHSMIISPWGDILASMDGESEGYVACELDTGVLEEVRRRLPSLQHRVL
ncbi:putative amidohydrolase [Chytriomyces cf. hyalinus JEL632]|nr:putative amidohydrolase [Chytriomyces cf. hyalinus JEL632]